MASFHFEFWWMQSWWLSTSNFIIGRITTVSMLRNFIIPSLMTRTVIYPHHWSCLPSLHGAMLSWSGKRTKAFIWELPSQSWKRTDLIAQTTWITGTTVVRTHPAALQRVAICQPRLALQTHTHSWGLVGTHYQRASNRGCIMTLLLQSSVRSNRRRTKCLPWWSGWKQCVLTMLFILNIWPPKWRLSSLRSKELI